MKPRDIILAIVIYIIFPISSIITKYAAMTEDLWNKFLLYGASVVVLAIFSVFWQILLKRVDLVKAYIFKSTSIIWTVIYGVLIFNDVLTANVIIGTIIVMIGTVIAILGGETKKETKPAQKEKVNG